jgi:catechol 2,3-dioxygenase-like lactoylglutathione lyase family enzyme
MRLNQVTVAATNIDASIAFYRMLGLRLIVQSPHYARFEMPAGESTFSLHLADAGPGNHAPTIYFECDDLDGEVARLKGEGLVFDADPVDQSWLWREAYLRDPAGNVLCLYRAGENRTHPPWRLTEG